MYTLLLSDLIKVAYMCTKVRNIYLQTFVPILLQLTLLNMATLGSVESGSNGRTVFD